MMARPFDRPPERRKLDLASKGTAMRRPPLSLAALAMLGACATAPVEPEAEAAPEAIAGPTERYGPPMEQRAMALVAAEPAGSIPSGLQVSILSVEETAAGLL